MLNVWKKFLTLEAAFLTLFNKKGLPPELSAQVVCGIPGVAGNQTEILGKAGGEKGMANFIIIDDNESFSQKFLTTERTLCKAQWRNGIGCGCFSGVFSAMAWLQGGATSLTHFLHSCVRESSDHFSITQPLRLLLCPSGTIMEMQ